jgi:carbohydrate-selective porin OprB
MTLTPCGHPRALTSNQGFTDWPTASWGGRIRAQPTVDTYIMAGIYVSATLPGQVERGGGEISVVSESTDTNQSSSIVRL